MAVCDDCAAFKMFGEKCWFYWQGKRKCSQFRRTQDDEPHFEEDLVQIRF